MPFPQPLVPLALALAAWPASSCSAPGSASAPNPDGRPAAEHRDPEEGRAEDERVIAAVRAGELGAAHEILGEMLVRRHLAQARALFATDPPNPSDGLLSIDEALEIDAENGEALLLHGEGSVLLAEQLIAKGANGMYITGSYESALDSFRRAANQMPANARALFGASRAAYNLSQFDEALDFATRGMEAIGAGADATGIAPSPARLFAEASYGAYANAMANAAGPADAEELFTLTEGALGRLLGLNSTDPWVWTTLGNLYLWAGRPEEAMSTLERGLDRAPTDGRMLAKLVDIARENGGSQTALLRINAFVNAHPDVAGGFWWLGRERFDLACTRLREGAADEFAAAERAFARARELDSSLTADCKGYEVVCRAGVGWSRYHSNDLEGAVAAFLSMNEVMERGIEWDYPERLSSGIQGLALAGNQYAERGDWLSAAEVFGKLFELQPDRADWANNQGFFLRDQAVALEQLGRDLCEQAALLPSDPQALARWLERAGLPADLQGDLGAALKAKAEENLSRAAELMEQSYAAYQNAARLAPDDVRLVNDTALVAIYYVDRDLERAEEMLLGCIELGTRGLEDASLEREARIELENALGDSYENLGYLYLVRRREPEKARPFLEKALGLGDPRPKVTMQMLPLCSEPPDHPTLVEWRSWGRPCDAVGPGDPVR